jgi:hypothetical protein
LAELAELRSSKIVKNRDLNPEDSKRLMNRKDYINPHLAQPAIEFSTALFKGSPYEKCVRVE